MSRLCVNILFRITFLYLSSPRKSLSSASGLCTCLFIVFHSSLLLEAHPAWVGGPGVESGSFQNDHKASCICSSAWKLVMVDWLHTSHRCPAHPIIQSNSVEKGFRSTDEGFIVSLFLQDSGTSLDGKLLEVSFLKLSWRNVVPCCHYVPVSSSMPQT